MSDERVDIQQLLQAGCYPTARSRSQDPDSRDEPEPLERAPRFYSGTNGKVETVHVGDTRGRAPRRATTPPPPPTVEDAGDDDPEFADEKPKFRGDPDQHPLIIDNENYVTNTEQRFVLVSNPKEKTPGRDGRRTEEPADRGRQAEKAPDAGPSTPPRRVATPTIDAETPSAGAAATTAAAATSETRRRPSVRRRRRSPADLPRIETDMFGPRGEDSKHGRSHSSAPTYDSNYRYKAPRSPDRPSRSSRDDVLPPEVIKSGKSREESSYYGASRRPRPPRHTERPSSSSNRRREEAYYNTGYLETPESGGRTRLDPDLRSARESRRTSPRPRDDDVFVMDSGLEDRSAFYPDLSRGAASPPRRQGPRVRRYTNQYSGDESETSSIRRSGRRPIVIQTDGRSTNTLTGEDARQADSRLWPRSSTVSSKQNGYRDIGPRGPRSPTSGSQPFDSSSVNPPYPVEDMMPSHNRPGYLEPDHWSPGTGPRGPQPTTTVPIRIPGPPGPRESRPGSRGQGIPHSWQPSPPKPRGAWQDNLAAATRYLPPGPKQPHISVRGYYEDPRRLELPVVPPCPRKEPVAGKTDWRTLPDDDLFTICPTCYKNIFSDSQYRDHFRPLPPQDPSMKFFCDFGSSPWYVVAWLISLKLGVRDLRLFQEVSRIAADYAKTGSECPGASRELRLWHSIRDPATNLLLPGFNICRECVRILVVLMPNLKNVLSTPGVNGSSVCSLHCGPDKGPFLLYFDAFERASDEAGVVGTLIAEEKLVEDIAAVARPMTCPRDGALFKTNWYYIRWLPELTVCEACYEDVARPVLGESARAAQNFGMLEGEFPEATCQLYSKRMRDLFMEACRRDDPRMLEDVVFERRDKEAEFKSKMERWEKVGHGFAAEEIERLKEAWKTWE